MKENKKNILLGVWSPNMKDIIKKYSNVKEAFEKTKNMTFFKMCKFINGIKDGK